jgi:hypothetical protein
LNFARFAGGIVAIAQERHLALQEIPGDLAVAPFAGEQSRRCGVAARVTA